MLLYGAECKTTRKKEENLLRRTETLNDDLKTLQNWLNSNKLSLNAIKTEFYFDNAGAQCGFYQLLNMFKVRKNLTS